MVTARLKAAKSFPVVAAQIKRAIKSSPTLVRVVVPIFLAKSIALAHVPATGEFPQLAGVRLDTFDFASLAEFDVWKAENKGLILVWEEEDEKVATSEAFAFRIEGDCALCNDAVSFLVTAEYGSIDNTGRMRPKWREHVVCPHCKMRNRVRAAIHFAIQECGMTPDKRIYLTEQFGGNYRWMRGRFRHVSGSEYLSPAKAPGSRMLGITHQDLHDLTYAADSFDHVLSFDVLEHVPDYRAAFSSIARVLGSGGKLIMTVPFTLDKYDTTVRAVMHPDGHIEHLLPIEVHGNPTDPINGALCFRNFGWDVLDSLKDSDFSEAKVHIYHSRELGYLGGMQSLISATKA
ncbi:MAG: class I SAM-dependent methyltransferase [Mycobacterium sp.]